MANLQNANVEVPRIALSGRPDRFLLLARVGWPIYVTLLMTIFIAGMQVRYLELTNPPSAVVAGLDRLSFTTGGYAIYNLLLEAIFAFGFLAVATLIYARNQNDGMGIFTVYTLTTFGTAAAPITVTIDSLVNMAPQSASTSADTSLRSLGDDDPAVLPVSGRAFRQPAIAAVYYTVFCWCRCLEYVPEGRR